MKGLTLVEVLIAMGISIIVGGLLLIIIVNSAGLYSQQSAKLTEGLSINEATSKVRDSIKQSSAIEVSLSAGSTTYTSGATQLVLKVLAIDSSKNIIADNFDYFVFFQDSNKLRFKTFPSALSSRQAQDQIFSTLLDSLDFKYFNSANPPVEVTPTNAAKVRISITLKQNTATSEANLRND